jgi:hypothetical protein
MKYLLLILSLLVNSCTCISGTNTRSPTIAVKKLSCYGGTCCFPYLHHKDVKGYHFMLCADQSPDIMGIEPHSFYDTNGYDSLRVSVKTYFLNP